MRTRRAQQKRRYRVFDGKHSVELKLKTPHQLFDERDPAPFRERDLDDDAAQYIFGSYRDLRGQGEVRLSLYFETLGTFRGRPRDITDAIHEHFRYLAETKRRELKDIFREGTISFAIGLTFLFVATMVGAHVDLLALWYPESTVVPMVKEGVHIMWWCAMWRPISIFLYEWWPIRDAMKDYQMLGEIEVEIQPRDLPLYHQQAAGEDRPLHWKREPSTVG